MRLKEVVDTVIESDLPAVEKITFDTLEKCKKLLMIIAENVPLQPNVDRLAVSLGTTRPRLKSGHFGRSSLLTSLHP